MSEHVAPFNLIAMPCVRADWFTAVASRPPLYYDLLQLPTTDRELEALVHVDAAEDIRAERIVERGSTTPACRETTA